MPIAVLDDGSRLDLSIHGEGPTLLVPCAAASPEVSGGPRRFSAELVAGLAQHARVIAFDYEAHRLRHPRSTTLTLDTVAQDMLTIADAVGAGSFSYLGHSWLALVAPHLASITRRVRGIALAGLSPLDPPLAELLDLAIRDHHNAIAGYRPRSAEDGPRGHAGPEPRYTLQAHPRQDRARARQFVTFFDDAHGTCSLARARILSLGIPRVCLMELGDATPALPGHIRLDDRVLDSRRALERSGWTVAVLTTGGSEPGPDEALGILLRWLARVHPQPVPVRD